MLLKDFVELKHCNFIEKANDWQDAMRKACEPLVADGTVDESYSDAIIESVKKNGPYIVLIPGVAMPHSMINAGGVNGTAVSFMKCEQPVFFSEDDEEKYGTIFLTVCAVNTDDHLKNMKQVFSMLTSEDLLADLMRVHCAEDLLKLDKKYEKRLGSSITAEEEC
jgi:PTS system ascorbate-specific IIA component